MKKGKELTADELSVLCYQLSLMVKAGIGSEESVGILAADLPEGRSKELLRQVHAVLLRGDSLSQGLSEAGGFPGYFLRMVEIGERSGRLEQVLAALSAYYRRESALRAGLRQTILYPAVMAVLIAVVFLALVMRVLPVFPQVFQQLGVSLSPVARGLMQFGSVSKYVAMVFAVALVLGALWVLWMFRTAKGQAAMSRLLSRTAASKAVDRSRFAAASALLSDTALSDGLKACQAAMLDGVPFPKAVEESGIFTGLQAGLLAAGFRSGASEQAMEELARRCQEEADQALSSLLGRFEYTLVIVLCLAVGLVLLSVMLPLLGVLSAIG